MSNPLKRHRPNGNTDIASSQPPKVESRNICKQIISEMEQYLKKLSTINQSAKSHLEIELRLGINMGKSFRSGVTKEFFEEYAASLRASGYSCTETDETDYKVGDNPFFNRVTVDHNSTITAMNKTPLTHPIDLPHRFRYDCRMSTCRETIILNDVPTEIPTKFESMRRKEREQFERDKDLWFIHLTKVTSHSLDGEATGTTFEIEYELKDPSAITDEKNRINMIREVWNILLNLLGNVVARLEMNLGEIESKHIPYLENECWKAVRPDQRGNGFPGSMPVSFSRRHMRNLQNNDYVLSEKTDGIRYMMLILESGTFMIGRKFDFYVLQGFPHLELLAKHGSTLIDGELVETLSRNPGERSSISFMIFDVIQYQGQFIGDEPLRSRLTKIGEIVQWFRNTHLKNKIPTPFILIGKTFYNKKQFDDLRKKIKKEGHDRIYDDERSRRHRTDGFIFTPNEAYCTKGTPNLYKWKYSDLLSIDFRIIPDKQGGLMFACGGNDNSLIPCRSMELLPEDHSIVMRIIDSNRVLRGFEMDPHYNWLYNEHGAVILEMTYDASAGVWRFHVERSDKSTPNYITIVFDTMEAIAENITESEIYYRVPLRTPDDHWEERKNS